MLIHKYIYRVVFSLEDVYKGDNNKAYAINWVLYHLIDQVSEDLHGSTIYSLGEKERYRFVTALGISGVNLEEGQESTCKAVLSSLYLSILNHQLVHAQWDIGMISYHFFE